MHMHMIWRVPVEIWGTCDYPPVEYAPFDLALPVSHLFIDAAVWYVWSTLLVCT